MHLVTNNTNLPDKRFRLNPAVPTWARKPFMSNLARVTAESHLGGIWQRMTWATEPPFKKLKCVNYHVNHRKLIRIHNQNLEATAGRIWCTFFVLSISKTRFRRGFEASQRFSKRQYESRLQNLHLLSQQLAPLWPSGLRREEVRPCARFPLCEPHTEVTSSDQSDWSPSGEP